MITVRRLSQESLAREGDIRNDMAELFPWVLVANKSIHRLMQAAAREEASFRGVVFHGYRSAYIPALNTIIINPHEWRSSSTTLKVVPCRSGSENLCPCKRSATAITTWNEPTEKSQKHASLRVNAPTHGVSPKTLTCGDKKPKKM